MSVQMVLVVKTIVQVYWTTSVVMIILEIKPCFVRIRAELLNTGFPYSYYSQQREINKQLVYDLRILSTNPIVNGQSLSTFLGN